MFWQNRVSGQSGGGGAAGPDTVARSGVIANDADIAALQTAMPGKVDQSAFDAMVADNATQAELDAVQSALQTTIDAKPDIVLLNAARQPNQAILLTYSDATTQTVAPSVAPSQLWGRVQEVDINGNLLATFSTIQVVKDGPRSFVVGVTSDGDQFGA